VGLAKLEGNELSGVSDRVTDPLLPTCHCEEPVRATWQSIWNFRWIAASRPAGRAMTNGELMAEAKRLAVEIECQMDCRAPQSGNRNDKWCVQ
jgi:hypothetical protein